VDRVQKDFTVMGIHNGEIAKEKQTERKDGFDEEPEQSYEARKIYKNYKLIQIHKAFQNQL